LESLDAKGRSTLHSLLLELGRDEAIDAAARVG
jgi:hypothetical protein